MMCRSLLEEILEKLITRKLPDSFKVGRLADPKHRALGDLLEFVNNNLPDLAIDPDIPILIRLVNTMGSRAAHDRNLEDQQAFECVMNTHKIIFSLLRHPL
jgi:hypothetical protein